MHVGIANPLPPQAGTTNRPAMAVALTRLSALDDLENAFDAGIKKARGSARLLAPQRSMLATALASLKSNVFLQIRLHCEASETGEQKSRILVAPTAFVSLCLCHGCQCTISLDHCFAYCFMECRV